MPPLSDAHCQVLGRRYDLIRKAAVDRLAQRVLFDNAVTFYRPRVAPAAEEPANQKGMEE